MTVHIRNLKEIAILNKDLVLGDPPLMVKDRTYAFLLIVGPFPNVKNRSKGNYEKSKHLKFFKICPLLCDI